MHIYSSSEYNQTGAFFRLVNAMQQAKMSNRGFTIFVGAGCSLSSSEDISTSKIIKKCVKRCSNPNYLIPDSWEELYRDFINNAWMPLGELERQEMLEMFFLDLTPSIGYINLRKLVEHGFITDIITTNFDMLIDEALNGLAYTVQVGNLTPRRIKGGSRVTLYKIHGDIESGELRFSPSELRELPPNVRDIINTCSKKSCVFCGYSGQDQGLMKSLEMVSGYSVFWTSPKKPIKDDVYGTKYIYDWLSARNSESNFIYGDELGKFDGLMENLSVALIEGKSVNSMTQWKNNTISEAIQLNKQIYSIFEQLLQCSSILRQQYEWQECFPLFSKDYETTLNAYLYYYVSGSTLPPSLLQIPENEVEALIMGLIIEIIASASGVMISFYEYTNKLKENYEKSNPDYFPDTSFWDAIFAILNSIKNNTPLQNDERIMDVIIKMNSKGRMTLSVKEPNLRYVVDVISLIGISNLFIPTCEKEADNYGLGKAKMLIQKHGQAVHVVDNKLCFKLDRISKNELQYIYKAFFSNLDNFLLDDNNIINGPNVKIFSNIVNKPPVEPAASISDYIYHIVENTTKSYLTLKSVFEIDNEKYVNNPLDIALNDFFASERQGMFIIGSSGSGKTRAIQNFVRLKLKSNNLIAVVSPKTTSFDNTVGLTVFWENLIAKNNDAQLLKEINHTLLLRNKYLTLIIDGLNEIDGGTNICIKHYKSIIETLEKLRTYNLHMIKVIVTCRDHAFLDYCEKENLYPPAEICYCSISMEHVKPYYQLKNLTHEQQLEYTKVYFNNNEKRKAFEADLKTNIKRRYIFNQPYLIAIAGKYYDTQKCDSEIFTMQEIFKFYAEQMLKRLGGDSSINTARLIINTYFDIIVNSDRFGRRVTPYILLNQLSNQNNNEQASNVLRQLCDINLFTNIYDGDYIKFTHDRIEEYFLCEYLYANSNDSKILIRFFEILSIDSIFYSAAVEYFKKLSQQNRIDQIIENYDLLYNYSLEHLPCIIISCLDTLSLDDYKKFFLAAEKSKTDLKTFIIFLFNGLKQVLYRNDICFPEEFITSYDVLSTLFPVLSQYSKYFYYISSRYYLIQKGDIKISEYYCDVALSMKTEDKHLTNIVEFQKAVILKHKNQLDDAINKFNYLYIYFSSCQEWEGAAECILEWGGALREKTLFSKALEIYEKIDILKLKSLPALQSKLHRKRGTVHKNIMQQLLGEYKSNRKQEIYNKIYHCFNKALDEYDSAKKGMVKVVDAIEKMVIISEQAEICLKIANLEPKQMYRAEMFISEHEHLLATFPIRDSKIVYLRHKSKYEEMKGNIFEAINILENAREIAIIGSKSFRVFEVDYQLGRLIERNKETLAMKDLEKGMEALNKAINTELGNDSQYIVNCIKTKASLEEYISNINY